MSRRGYPPGPIPPAPARPQPPPCHWTIDGLQYAFDVRTDDPRADRRTAEDLGEIPMRMRRRIARWWRATLGA